MRTDFAKDWVAALRSGEYHQGYGQLRRVSREPDGDVVEYCCLGVACEIGIRYGVVERRGNEYWSIGDAALGYEDWNPATLPTGFWIWLGLRTSDPHPPHSASLSSLNDDRGADFTEIADLIEEFWLAAELAAS